MNRPATDASERIVGKLSLTPRLIGSGLIFDNSLNIEGLRIKGRMENGYEEGCTRGARFQSANSGGSWLTRDPVGMTRRGFVVSPHFSSSYTPPHTLADSPFRRNLSGARAEPSTFATETRANLLRILRFSVSCSPPFNRPISASTPLRRFEDSSGRYPSKAGQAVCPAGRKPPDSGTAVERKPLWVSSAPPLRRGRGDSQRLKFGGRTSLPSDIHSASPRRRSPCATTFISPRNPARSQVRSPRSWRKDISAAGKAELSIHPQAKASRM